MNKVMLLGTICNELELKTGNDQSYVKFRLAVPHRTKDRGVDFIPCIAWNKDAEFMQKYFHKGNRVCISGRLLTGQYDDKDGKRVRTMDVVVEEVDFADSKSDDKKGESTTKQENVEDLGTKQFEQAEVTDEELPF